MMRLGIHADYRDHQNIWAALRIGQFCLNHGMEVSIYVPGKKIRRVHRDWDRRTVCRPHDFLTWTRSCSTVLWPEPPPAEFIKETRRLGSNTVMLGLWESFEEGFKDAYSAVETVVTPCQQAQALLEEKWGLQRVRHIPWDSGLPFFRNLRKTPTGAVGFVLPLHGAPSLYISPEIVTVVGDLLAVVPKFGLTVIWSKQWNSGSRRVLKSLRRQFESSGRLHVICAEELSREEMLAVYGSAAAVMFMAELDGLGALPLEAMSSGTPVIAYDVPPFSEYIRHRKNSILIPCELTYSEMAVPRAVHNADGIQFAVVELLENRQLYSTVLRGAGSGLSSRRLKFEQGWSEVLGL